MITFWTTPTLKPLKVGFYKTNENQSNSDQSQQTQLIQQINHALQMHKLASSLGKCLRAGLIGFSNSKWTQNYTFNTQLKTAPTIKSILTINQKELLEGIN